MGAAEGNREQDGGAGSYSPPAEASNAPQPGWYSDPTTPNAQRYWDGSQWTEHVAPSAAAQAVGARKSGKATASLVLGIVGFIILPIILHVLAVIFAVSARSDIARDPTIENKGSATAGLWLGIVGLAVWALVVIVALAGNS